MVENEHLRMEVEALRNTNVANVGAQIGFKEADSKSVVLVKDKITNTNVAQITKLTKYAIFLVQLELMQQSFVLLNSKRDMQSW